MIKKKIIGLLALTTLTTINLIGCQKTDEIDVNNTEEQIAESIDLKKDSIENILLTYNEQGMKLLKAYYPDTESMEIALRNIGNTLSDLKLKDINGLEVSINKYKGKKVVFEVMQDSCEYCKASTSAIDSEIKKREDVIVVPIFLNSTKEGIEQFYNEVGIEKPKEIWIDDNKDIAKEFNLTKTPALIFVDENGKISLIKQQDYDEVTIKDDLIVAFDNEKLYNMKINNNK